MENEKFAEQMKMKKEELLKLLAYTKSQIKDKEMIKRVDYTLKKAKESLANVTKSDIIHLMNDAAATLRAPAAVPVANSPKLKAPTKSTAKPAATPSAPATVAAPAAKAEKPAATKSAASKPAPRTAAKAEKPAEEVVEGKGVSKKDVFAKVFPEKITVEGIGELTRSKMTFKEIIDKIAAGEDVFFANYWTTRHIKEWDYENTRLVKIPKGKFPQNLDVCATVVTCETMPRLFAMSVYTEAMFQYDEKDFSYVEETDDAGNKFQLRVSAGMEFEVYVP